MLVLKQTEAFRLWEQSLRDPLAQAAVASRLARLALGHLGDCKALGGGVAELRIHTGPGYRIYFTRRGSELILLLCGGNKADQSRDVERARNLARKYDDEN